MRSLGRRPQEFTIAQPGNALGAGGDDRVDDPALAPNTSESGPFDEGLPHLERSNDTDVKRC